MEVTFDFHKPLAPVSSNRRWFGYISHRFRFSDLEHLDPFKKNKRVSLIKKMVLKRLGDEI